MTPRFRPGDTRNPQGRALHNTEALRSHCRPAEHRGASIEAVIHESVKGGRRHRALESRGGVHPASHAGTPEARTVAVSGTVEQPEDDSPAEIQRLGQLVRALQRKMITVCAWSRKIEYEGEWLTFEEFLFRSLNIPSSHGVSPLAFDEVMAQMRAEASLTEEDR